MKRIISIIILTITMILLISSASKQEQGNEEGYRIEIKRDTIESKEGRRTEEYVVFISPEGKEIRRIELSVKSWKEGEKWSLREKKIDAILQEKGLIIISEIKGERPYDPQVPAEYPVVRGEYWNYEVELLNEKGEVLFTKEFRTYPEDDPTHYYWKVAISKEGNRVLFYYKDSKGVSHIEVCNLEGNKIAEARNKKDITYIEISPDGKIVGGKTYKQINGKWGRYLYFLNVETGEEKICKAEGEIDGKKWSASFDLRKNKKIGLNGGWWNIKSGQSVKTDFDKIPENLSILFQQEGNQ